MTIERFARGRTALVSGASGGIGAAMARQLGAVGARVLLVARTEASLAAVAAEIRAAGGEARVLVADLEVPGASAALVARLGEPVDVLVANAGFGVVGPFAGASPAAVSGMVTLNVLALTDLARLLLPAMTERRGGGLLTVASIAAFTPAPAFAVYAATKAYVLSLTDALHAEARGTGVHVTCLCPGPVATGFGARAGMDAGFFAGHLSAGAVAEAGLSGLARNRRRVVPGLLNRAQTLAAGFAPTALAMRVAEARLRA